MDGYDIARMQLAAVLDPLFHCRHAGVFLAQPRRGEAQEGEELPGGFVELADVPHHVHMPHVVAMPGIDGATVGQVVVHVRFPRSCWNG
ncbi:hypothetical protein D3C76_1657930 [compost metagenome]